MLLLSLPVMKTARFFLAILAVGLLQSWSIPRAFALTVIEPPDFANDAASAATYVLDLGGNDFSGAIGGGDVDFFKVTVLPGRKVTLIQTSGSATNSVPVPLYAGTYTFSKTGLVLPGNEAWGFTFTVAAAPDYEVTSSGGQIVVTDRSGFGDTLTVSAQGGSTIKFAAPGRTFSLNGAAFITGDSGSIPYALGGVITVNAGAGDDTIVVGSLGSLFPNFTLNGGTGDDTVNFTGDITFIGFSSLNVDLQDDAASPGADSVNVAANVHLTTSEAGAITVRCSRSVSLGSGASLTTEYGTLTVEANQQEPATPGNFVGVNLSGTTLRCTGNNFAATTLTVKGRGGNDAGGYQLGVNLDSGAIIGGGERVNVNVTGTGGAGSGSVNRGVTLNGAGTRIESTSTTVGMVNVTGTGGPVSANFGIGVSLLNGTVRATGPATVTVTGTGAGAPGSGVNSGVEMGGAGAAITSAGGGISVRGVAGPGGSIGVSVDNFATISMPVGENSIDVQTDSLAISSTSSITTNATSAVLFLPDSPTTIADLGGENAPGRLGLSDVKLDRVFTSALFVRNFGSGAIELTAPITRATATDLYLFAVSGGIRAPGTGTDVSLAGGTLKLGVVPSATESRLVMPITSATADTGYPRLSVAGGVDLNSRTLDLTGTTFAGVAGNTFTLVENDGTDAIVGTFRDLPEGASVAWPGSSVLNARISYTGGSGNDAVLTLVSALEVTNANFSGTGSLRAVLTYAASKPGADTVTFHPSLSGATIFPDGEIVIDDPDAVTVDASSLPAGVTIGGGPGSNRLFSVSSGKSLALLGLSLTGAHGGGALQSGNGNAIANFGTLVLTRCVLSNNTRASGSGGAILNDGGTLTLTQCTLTGNSTTDGGAIYQTTGSMMLTQCTLAGNTAGSNGDGGAIHKVNGAATLTHCTLSGNHAALSGGDGGAITQTFGTLALTHCTVSGNEAEFGGGISNRTGTTTLTHSIVAGNTAIGSGPDIFNQPGATTTGVGQNIVQGISGSGFSGTFLNAPPLLAPLGDYGGPTQTVALLPGSPAREAAPTSTATSDQRGQPIFGLPDIGAYEAGIPRNYAAWNYETLPANALLAQRAPGFDFDGDGRPNVLEYATFTDGAVPGGCTGTTFLRTPDGTEARFSFPLNSFATDLLYELQRSLPGVGPWVTIGDVNLRTSVIHNYGVGVTNVPGFFSIEFRDPGIAGQGKAFYRLRVNVP